jgi:hypothetical protein
MKTEAYQDITKGIELYGYFAYLVQGGIKPRYGYTIGLSQLIGSEIIFAGGSLFSMLEVSKIIDYAVSILKLFPTKTDFEVPNSDLGQFKLRPVHSSWTEKLLLGAVEYYKPNSIIACQVVPDESHTTIDVPDLSQSFDPEREPIWQWFTRPWEYNISKKSKAMTDVYVLQGALVIEVARWEVTYWELFSKNGKELDESEVRAIPLATLLGSDPTLSKVVELAVGKGILRTKEDQEWYPWESHSDSL